MSLDRPPMVVLLVGSGGREHALATKLSQSPRVEALHCCPGNAGIAQVAHCHAVAADDVDAVVGLARQIRADLVVVGPEAPLVAGLVDALEAQDITAFGPTAAAARIEGSKRFAKRLMVDAGVPTARHAAFSSHAAARAYALASEGPLVVKADGLAAGKGVHVCDTRVEAVKAIDALAAARTPAIVLEERLAGPELSVLALVDGVDVVLLPPARDHKRAYDADTGPNTGGMGAFSPVPGVGTQLLDEVERTIIRPVVRALAERGTPFRGVLYAGLMLTADGPMAIEFNARFGDPEAQAILPRIDDDLALLLHACATGRLAQHGPVRVMAGTTVTVVAASEHYPARSRLGLPIELPDRPASGVEVFHSGTTTTPDGTTVTAGGRVLAVSATAATPTAARALAYEAIADIHFPGMRYRSDIALPTASLREVGHVAAV